MRRIFTEHFLDVFSTFIYANLKDKPKTKANIRKSIKTFEDIWVHSIREKKKNEIRKV